MKSKFKDRAKLVDKMERVNIKKMALTALEMKLHYGFDHYGERDKAMHAGISTHECPRCIEIET